MLETMSLSTEVRFDETAWPFVIVRWPPQTLSGSEFSAALARVSRYFDRGQHFGLVMDIRQAPMLSAERRRLIAEKIDEDRRLYAGRLVAIAIVTSSSFHRGIMNAINWLRQHPDPPMQGFADVAEALTWLRQRHRSRLDEAREPSQRT
jgi:hypothetical protein